MYCIKNNFALSLRNNKQEIKRIMFEFDQYLGFLAFLTILTIGFWLMIFLITFVIPYWIGGSVIERLNEIKEDKKASQSA